MTTRPQGPSIAPATRARLGGALLVLGTVQLVVMHLVVESAWTRPRYSWWHNYISDLGAVGCGPLLGNEVCSPEHAAMNTAFVAQGVLLLVGVVVSSPAWPPGGAGRAWTIAIGLVGLSWMVIGLVPEDVSLAGHSVGALPVFLLGNIALVAAGLARFTRSRPVVRTFALVLGVVGLAGLGLMALAGSGAPIGIGFAERVVVLPLPLWAVAAGISMMAAPLEPRGRARRPA